MTNKKKRQRGSRTHGGGSHKNRRGAGHRGGRGNAGRDKHEHHNHPPLGKEGFNSVNSRKTKTVSIKEIDEDIYEIEIGLKDVEEVDGITIIEDSKPIADGGAVLEKGSSDSQLESAPGAEEDNMRYKVDLPEYVEGYDEVDQVKLLDSGKIMNSFSAELDDCSRSAKRTITGAGGFVYYNLDSEGFSKATRPASVISKWHFKNSGNKNEDKVDDLNKYLEKVESGETLEFHEFDDLVEAGQAADPELAYEVMRGHAENLDDLDGIDVINIMRSREFADKYHFDPSVFEQLIGSYLGDLDPSDEQLELLRIGMSENYSVEDVLAGLDRIHDRFHIAQYDDRSELREQRIAEEERMYLLTVDGLVDWV
ncbi:uL15 family ribosomal protein [Halobellus rubicundus]|uniref:Large ribosomal subunit protein uL15 n=1 Tax=Halobellus rubicundus TaxID=2996466 RepID=A0ABD5MAM8_9EURY